MSLPALYLLCVGGVALGPADASETTYPPTPPAQGGVAGSGGKPSVVALDAKDIEQARDMLDAFRLEDAGDPDIGRSVLSLSLEEVAQQFPERLGSARSPEQVALHLSPDGDKAFAVVKYAALFNFGPVGITGQPAPEPFAVALLARSPAVPDAFCLLLKEATVAGQLHALYGLERVDRANFERSVVGYLAPREPSTLCQVVLRLQGCLGTPIAPADIVRDIFLGRFNPSYKPSVRMAFAARFRQFWQAASREGKLIAPAANATAETAKP